MRILQLCLQVPFPLAEGACIATYNTTRDLANRGHKLTLVAFQRVESAGVDLGPLREYCDVYPISFSGSNSPANVLRGVIERSPVNFVKFRSAEMLEQTLALLRSNTYDVLIIDHALLGWYMYQIKKHIQIPVITRFHDVHTLIWERWIESQSNPLKRFLGSQQYKFVKRFEQRLALDSDLCVMVGAHDADLLQKIAPEARVKYVRVGFDADRYNDIQSPEDSANILFLASHYRWHPNADAVQWLIEEIMPHVWDRVPGAVLHITGSDVTAKMREWAAATDRIVLTGYVPDDRTVISSSAVIVNPMRLGGGVKVKMLTAFASGRAVVSTSAGAEGVPGIVNGEHLFIRDDAKAFAEATVALISDRALRDRLAQTAKTMVRREWSWSAIGAEWEEALSCAVDAERHSNTVCA